MTTILRITALRLCSGSHETEGKHQTRGSRTCLCLRLPRLLARRRHTRGWRGGRLWLGRRLLLSPLGLPLRAPLLGSSLLLLLLRGGLGLLRVSSLAVQLAVGCIIHGLLLGDGVAGAQGLTSIGGKLANVRVLRLRREAGTGLGGGGRSSIPRIPMLLQVDWASRSDGSTPHR